MINYVIGDATEPISNGPKIIAHVVNDVGAWGRGFVLSISKKWPHVELTYRRMGRNGTPRLGETRLIEVEPGLLVANMVAQRGLISKSNPTPIQYDALADCLGAVASLAHKHSVHMPRIGCGLGGSDWSKVEPIVARELHGVDVFVYDLPVKVGP